MNEGTNKLTFELILKNNGAKPWPIKRTQLIYERESCFSGDEIILEPQKPGQQKKYDIILDNLSNFQPGEYNTILRFYIDDNPLGDQLILKIKIKENKNQKNKINEQKIVKEFRENYGLSENDYSDERLFEILKENQFNSEKAFEALFD